MSEAMWFSLHGCCSGCGKPALFERYRWGVRTLVGGEEHDSEACKAARDAAMRRAKKQEATA